MANYHENIRKMYEQDARFYAGFGIAMIVIIAAMLIAGTFFPPAKSKAEPETSGLYEMADPHTSGYRYAVWTRPDGIKEVFLCYRHGAERTSVFGMAQATNPDGTPATPEDLGIDLAGPKQGYPVPEVYEIAAPEGAKNCSYIVWVRPDGTKAVFLCYRHGVERTSVFGMAQVINPDGTPATPEDLGTK